MSDDQHSSDHLGGVEELNEETQTRGRGEKNDVSSDVPNSGTTSPEDAMETLRADMDAMEKKAREHWEQFLRTQAELDNLRKRTERDVQNAHKFAIERFARELLPVKDSLELGLQSSKDNDSEAAKMQEGVEMTLKMLAQVFEKFGLNEINPVGEPFNPELHQAMSTQPNDEMPPNSVVSVMQKGYVLNERVLRPALVIVSKASS